MAAALLVAVVVYVVVPIFIRGFQVDPAFSGILTGIIGLAGILSNKDNRPPPPPPMQ